MSFDYKKLGFRCGLEVHQQLETHNLFCECPSIVHDKNPTQVAVRVLKAVVGETGQIDAAAAHEQSKQKTMIYQGCPDSHCLVELDEEPPHPINQEALGIALQIAKMLHCEVVDEIQVMRKTVIDGSNVSGFQRTALVGINGFIQTSKGKVGIPTLCLEEEAAKRVRGGDDEDADSSTDDNAIFRLDRLGVCLVEIATDSTINDPEHARECAEILGMILRSTGKVKRGIGTIRQDVNVSITQGARVEIKGFQDLKFIPKVIDYEIERQIESAKKGKKPQREVRKAEPDQTTSFLRPMPGAARLYPETDILPITVSKQMLSSIQVPELLSDKKDSLAKKYGLDQGLISEIVRKGIDFEAYVTSFRKLDPKFIATVLAQLPKEIHRKENIEINLSDADFREILAKVAEGLPKDAVSEVMLKKAKGEKVNYSDYATLDDATLASEIQKIIKSKPGLNMGGYMGLVMAKFKGKIDGKKASMMIQKALR